MKSIKLKRVILLMRNEMVIKRQAYLLTLGLAIIATILSFNEINLFDILLSQTRSIGLTGQSTSYFYSSNFLTSGPTEMAKFHLNWFPKLLLGIGLVLCSIAFNEYKKGPSRDFHLGLPANSKEKWLAKIILLVIIYPIVFLLAYQIIANITYAFQSNINVHLVKIGIYDPYSWRSIVQYVGLSSLFIAGATFFKSNSLIKTSLAIGVLYLIWQTLLKFIVNTLLYGTDKSFVEGQTYFRNFSNFINSIFSFELYSILYMVVGCILFYYSYIKFQELEA